MREMRMVSAAADAIIVGATATALVILVWALVVFIVEVGRVVL